MQFSGKVVLVTGGSQGIGAAICERFAAEGATVAVVASSNRNKAQIVADAIEKDGGNAKAFACDVADVAEINTLVANVLATFRRIDILINSAGVFYPTVIGETDESMFDRMCDINLKGTFFMVTPR